MNIANRKAPKLHLGKSEWVVLGAIFVYSFIPVVGGLIRVLELVGGPQIAPANARALLAPFKIQKGLSLSQAVKQLCYCSFGRQ